MENFDYDENKNGFQIKLGLDYGHLQDLSDPEVLARIGNRAVKTVNKPSSEYFSSIISILTTRSRNVEIDLVFQSNATIVSGISLKRVAPHLERCIFLSPIVSVLHFYSITAILISIMSVII